MSWKLANGHVRTSASSFGGVGPGSGILQPADFEFSTQNPIKEWKKLFFDNFRWTEKFADGLVL